jgi:putative DNA primase/helicase
MSEAEKLAQGRWPELLPRLGVDNKFLVNRHGPCPICGGRDRFRFDNKEGRGTFFCNSCGVGDGYKLTQLVTGKSFATIVDEICSITGQVSKWTQGKDDQRDKQKALIKRIWDASKAVTKDGPVGRYLKDRTTQYWAFKSIRQYLGQHHCLMVCKIISPSDEAVNCHLTYLTSDGRKADVAPNRRIMAGQLPNGSAIRLGDAAEVMGIAEGIETALAAQVMFQLPVWSAINAQNLSKWVPPKVAKKIVIFGDNDSTYTGQAAAYTLAKRLVVQHDCSVEVKIPQNVDRDWADLLVMGAKGPTLQL